MSALASEPRVLDVAASAAILVGFYLAARLLSFLFSRVLARAASRTPTTLDDRMVAALERPLAWMLVLAGGYVAVARLPAPARVAAAAEAALFVLGVLLAAAAAVRAYSILLDWYATESRAGRETALAAEFRPLLTKVGAVFIGLVASITVLQHFGVNVASLVVSLGVGSLAIGLAAQDTLANMFAGFTLLADRPFRIGDRIQLATGEQGDVEAIGIRATHIRTTEGSLLVAPNSLLVKDRLVNFTHPGNRLVARVEVTVSYGAELALVKRLLEEAAAGPDVEREPPPAVQVVGFTDLGIRMALIFHVRNHGRLGPARSQALEEAYGRLREAGVEMASLARPAAEPARTPGVRG